MYDVLTGQGEIVRENLTWTRAKSLVKDLSSSDPEAYIVSSTSGRHYGLRRRPLGRLDLEIQSRGGKPKRLLGLGYQEPGYRVLTSGSSKSESSSRSWEDEYLGLPEVVDQMSGLGESYVEIETEDGQMIGIDYSTSPISVDQMVHPQLDYADSISKAVKRGKYLEARGLLNDRSRLADSRIKAVVQALSRLQDSDVAGDLGHLSGPGNVEQWIADDSDLTQDDVDQFVEFEMRRGS